MPNEEKKPSVSPLALIAGALVIVAVTTFAFLQKKESQENSPAAEQPVASQPAAEKTEPASSKQQDPQPQNFRMPPFHQNADAIALQPTLDPMTVPAAAQSGYIVAQQKPKLLAQLPCFCYCDKFGHGSLHDCFVSDHAASCDICLKEALRADEMDKQGIPATQIRNVIVSQFHPVDHTH